MLVPEPARPVPWLRFAAVLASMFAVVMMTTEDSVVWGAVALVTMILTVVV